MAILGVIVGSIILILVPRLWRFILFIAWKPYSISKRLCEQGIRGPKRNFLYGNMHEIRSLEKEASNIKLDIDSHDIVSKVHPHYFKWMDLYGGTFLYWLGPIPTVCITNAEQAKIILSNKFGFFTKSKPPETVCKLLGHRGIFFSEGSDWARHRRIVSPAFSMDKLKLMTKEMIECTRSMLDSWQNNIKQTDEGHNCIEVHKQFQELTADILSHAAFGSSFKEGNEVFLAQKELQKIIMTTLFNVKIPGFKYVPTKENRRKWMLYRKVENTLTNIISKRMKSKNSGYGKDLLGLMMESVDNEKLTLMELIDECKTFYFAGQDTTTQLLTWTMFLLSTNSDWQEKLRHEILNECGTKMPSSDNLTKFKLMTMVLLEALRLYSPALTVHREASQDIDLCGVIIPKGTMLSIPSMILHRKKELWGENANEFDPLRFENGVEKAGNHPNAMLAFSTGPRICVGQNFAMIEAKMIVSMILQRFSFTLSKDYCHMPENMGTLQPNNGMQIVFKPLIS